jgi:hypothetical protein
MTRLMRDVRGLAAFLALSAVAAAAATIGASEPMAWRFAHPEAQVLAGVDFHKLAETPDGRQLREQFVAALGAPLLEQAERLLLSSVVDAGGKRSDVLILSGSFSLAQLRKMAMHEGAKMVPYKGLEIAAPAGATAADPHLAWMTGPGGSTTVLIGTRPAIQAAAERSKAHVESLASVNPLFGRARDLSGPYPVWVTCDTVPQGFGPKALDQFIAGELPEVDAGEVNGFDLGLQPGKSPELNMWVWTTTEATPALVLKQFSAPGNPKGTFVLSSWLPGLKAGVDGKALVMGAPIAAGTMAARVGPLLAAFALPVDVRTAAPVSIANIAIRPKVESNVPTTGLAKPAPSVAAVAPVPAAPPKKLFVRIEGLDEGVKDIPYAQKP